MNFIKYYSSKYKKMNSTDQGHKIIQDKDSTKHMKNALDIKNMKQLYFVTKSVNLVMDLKQITQYKQKSNQIILEQCSN